MNSKVIISCALTGAATPKSKNPNLPVTPQEIADDAYSAWKAGASIVHMHMRDPDNVEVSSMDVALFRETIRLIRAHKDCDVIINCSSASLESDEIRMAPHIEISDVEIGSCDVGTFNWGDSWVFMNTPQFLHKLCAAYKEHDVKPEIEIFDYGMLKNAETYLKKGLIGDPFFCQLVLGLEGAMDATVENLVYLVNHLPKGTIWSCTGIGHGHLPMMYATLALGGHIRVGLEDNLYYSQGVKATNSMLVERAVRAVKEYGKTPATSAEAREILGLKPLTR